jgi:hypothetical protein
MACRACGGYAGDPAGVGEDEEAIALGAGRIQS